MSRLPNWSLIVIFATQLSVQVSADTQGQSVSVHQPAIRPCCDESPDSNADPANVDVELAQARAYLVETARPGGTMIRQGPTLAIERLHPEFTKRLAVAIREARLAGLAEVGIFSAYRPPVFGIGGFADKFHSLHAYGLAVDVFGIGAPSSAESKMWHEIAAKHGIICPYGYRHRIEWNHCQSTQVKIVKADNPLRATITREGPIDLERMFAVGERLIANLGTAIRSVVEVRPVSHGRRAAKRRISSRVLITTRSTRRQRTQVIAIRKGVVKVTAKRLALKRSGSRTKLAFVSRQTRRR